MLWFFRRETIHVVCRVPEKPQQRSRSDFLRRHQELIYRGQQQTINKCPFKLSSYFTSLEPALLSFDNGSLS